MTKKKSASTSSKATATATASKPRRRKKVARKKTQPQDKNANCPRTPGDSASVATGSQQRSATTEYLGGDTSSLPSEDTRHPDKPTPANKNKSRNRSKAKTAEYKPTAEEIESRCLKVAELITAGLYKHQIKEYANKTWGIAFRTTESYIARAKQILRDRHEFSKAEDDLSLALNYWFDLSNSRGLKPLERMKARERYEELILLQKTAERLYNETHEIAEQSTLGSISGIGRPRDQVIREAQEALQRMQAAADDAHQHSENADGQIDNP